MTRHDKLLENYEDALFALLMDQVAEEEGKQLLKENERLNQNPEAAIPDEVDKRCRKAIKRAFAKDQRQSVVRISYRAISKVALVALIAGLLFTTAFAASPEVRIRTLNLLIAVSDVATSLTLDSETDGTATSANTGVDPEGEQLILGYCLPELPEGFSMSYEGSDGQSAWVEYVDENGATIYFTAESSSGTTYNVDTEDADNVENIQIDGYDGLLIEKGKRIQIIWGDTDQENFVELVCNGIDKSDVISLASEIGFVISD